MKYGPQTSNECQQAGNPSWCNIDAGNGISSSNQQKFSEQIFGRQHQRE